MLIMKLTAYKHHLLLVLSLSIQLGEMASSLTTLVPFSSFLGMNGKRRSEAHIL